MYSKYKSEASQALASYIVDQSDANVPLPDEILGAYAASKQRSEERYHDVRRKAYLEYERLVEQAVRQFEEAEKLIKAQLQAAPDPAEEKFNADCGPANARFDASAEAKPYGLRRRFSCSVFC